jgi:hypothetical protein
VPVTCSSSSAECLWESTGRMVCSRFIFKSITVHEDGLTYCLWMMKEDTECTWMVQRLTVEKAQSSHWTETCSDASQIRATMMLECQCIDSSVTIWDYALELPPDGIKEDIFLAFGIVVAVWNIWNKFIGGNVVTSS